jgi:apolipoprotein N-acyltransferase
MQPPVDNLLVPQSEPEPSSWRGRGMRLLLFGLHIALLAVAFAQTPRDHAYQLGHDLGGILIVSCLVLWTVLYFATTTKNVLLFCALALAQVILLAILGLHYQSENRIVAEVVAELPKKQELWQARMSQFNMGPLYEMCEGERLLSLDELRELHARAEAAQIVIPELKTEMQQWQQSAVSRIAKISSQGAREFQLGMDSRQSESDEILQKTLRLYSEDQQLTQFLIQREGHYQMHEGTLVFDTEHDAKSFNDNVVTITLLRDRLNELVQKAKETSQSSGTGH